MLILTLAIGETRVPHLLGFGFYEDSSGGYFGFKMNLFQLDI